MRHALIVLWALCCAVVPATAQVSVSIGINVPLYPQLVRVPDYPVYYAPQLQSNYFFYDGVYWVYQGDNWYASSWYNGPWQLVDPEVVPLFVLRVPVRYYRQPPIYFRGWVSDAPPRWGEHWGRDWEQHRSGWDRWNRRAAPAPAPLPSYQRKYPGERYPGGDRQHEIQDRNYRYQPRDPVLRQHAEPPAHQDAPQPQRERPPVLHEKHTTEQDRPVGRPTPPPAAPQERRPQQEPKRGPDRDKENDREHDNGRGPDRNNRP